MKKISVKDFWRRFSVSSVYFKQHDKLPYEVSFMSFLNLYFGQLTRHNPVECNQSNVRIECSECEYIDNIRNDVCDAHLGIIEGQLERLFLRQIELVKNTKEGICIMCSK